MSLPPPAARISARWRGNDPAFGAKTLATYTGMYDTLLRQAQSQFVGDAREQAFFQYKIDNNLHAQTELYPADAALAGGDCGLDVPSRAAALVRPVDACGRQPRSTAWRSTRPHAARSSGSS